MHRVWAGRPAPAPRESVPLHRADEPRILVRGAAERVARGVEVDGEAPRVEGELAARLDPARGIAARVVAGVDETGEAAPRQFGERGAQVGDHRAVAGHRAEDRDAAADDVAVHEGGGEADP